MFKHATVVPVLPTHYSVHSSLSPSLLHLLPEVPVILVFRDDVPQPVVPLLLVTDGLVDGLGGRGGAGAARVVLIPLGLGRLLGGGLLGLGGNLLGAGLLGGGDGHSGRHVGSWGGGEERGQGGAEAYEKVEGRAGETV